MVQFFCKLSWDNPFGHKRQGINWEIRKNKQIIFCIYIVPSVFKSLHVYYFGIILITLRHVSIIIPTLQMGELKLRDYNLPKATE